MMCFTYISSPGPQPPVDLSAEALMTGLVSQPHESVLIMLLGLAVLVLMPMIFAQRRQQRRLLRQGL